MLCIIKIWFFYLISYLNNSIILCIFMEKMILLEIEHNLLNHIVTIYFFAEVSINILCCFLVFHNIFTFSIVNGQGTILVLLIRKEHVYMNILIFVFLGTLIVNFLRWYSRSVFLGHKPWIFSIQLNNVRGLRLFPTP